MVHCNRSEQRDAGKVAVRIAAVTRRALSATVGFLDASQRRDRMTAPGRMRTAATDPFRTFPVKALGTASDVSRLSCYLCPRLLTLSLGGCHGPNLCPID